MAERPVIMAKKARRISSGRGPGLNHSAPHNPPPLSGEAGRAATTRTQGHWGRTEGDPRERGARGDDRGLT
jgi:hypothetical protein